MHYIFNPVYAGADSFSQDMVNEASEVDFDTLSKELDSAKYKLMEMPFNEKTYRFIGDLNFHQALYIKDVMTGFDVGNLLLSKVSDSISIVSFGFDDGADVERLDSTIKMITKKSGLIWPDHIPEDIECLAAIREALVSKGLARVESLSELIKD